VTTDVDLEGAGTRFSVDGTQRRSVETAHATRARRARTTAHRRYEVSKDMPHEIDFDNARTLLRGRVDVAPDGATPLARIHRLADGDALALLAAPATRDGVPVLGNVVRVGWGESTVLRLAGHRLALVWSAELRREAAAGGTCRVCGGAFTRGESIVVCACESAHHEDCHRLRTDCLSCGAPA